MAGNGAEAVHCEGIRYTHMECMGAQVCRDEAAAYRACASARADLAARMHGYEGKSLEGAGDCGKEVAAMLKCLDRKGLEALAGVKR